MKNIYYNQIVELLTKKSEGMKLCNIAKNIYNRNCSLWEDEHLYHQIYNSTKRYLWHQSKLKRSPFCNVKGKWGVYALKKNFVVQLELCFEDWESDTIIHKPAPKKEVSKQPNLFGW